MKKTKPPKLNQNGMPSLTISGKREIVAMALRVMGERALLEWLKPYDIPSLRYLNENIRRYKTKFFEALFKLT